MNGYHRPIVDPPVSKHYSERPTWSVGRIGVSERVADIRSSIDWCEMCLRTYSTATHGATVNDWVGHVVGMRRLLSRTVKP